MDAYIDVVGSELREISNRKGDRSKLIASQAWAAGDDVELQVPSALRCCAVLSHVVVRA